VELNRGEHLETRIVDFSTLLENSSDNAANRVTG
jgi:hypothetical protein